MWWPNIEIGWGNKQNYIYMIIFIILKARVVSLCYHKIEIKLCLTAKCLFLFYYFLKCYFYKLL